MKKILAISSVFLMMTGVLTGCGADRDNGRNNGSYYEDHDYDKSDGNSAKDHAHDAVDGAKNAGEDIVDGAGDAANDIIDGLDGSTSSRERITTSHTTKATTAR